MIQISGDSPVTRYMETVTISSGTSLSGAADLQDRAVVGIIMPAAWTAASLTFQGSHDGVTYQDVYWDGSELALSEADASRSIAIDPAKLLPFRYIKVRSGTTAVAVNQGADRDVILVTREV